MTILFDDQPSPVEFILHPTDFSEASERAFHHALAIAIRRSAQLTLLHAGGHRDTVDARRFPSVRSKLAEWQAAGSTDGLVERMRRTKIEKLAVPNPDPVAASLEYIVQRRIDLIVLATEGRRGLARAVRPSRAEELAKKSFMLTLFVPNAGRSFVDGATGAVSLDHILIPVHPRRDPRPAMLRAVQSAALLENPMVEITMLHVGEAEPSDMELPQLPYCRWHVQSRRGDVVEEILSAAEDISAAAIYMSSGWQETDRARGKGGVTEQVLQSAPCPVAVVPTRT